MVCAGGDYGATRPDRGMSSIQGQRKQLHLIGAAALSFCVIAVVLGVQRHDDVDSAVVLKSTQKEKSKGSSVGDIQKQLLKAKELFDGAPPVPSDGSNRSPLGGPSESSGPANNGGHGRESLGLKGMSQTQFERDVDGAVTKKVAQALLKTIRPLKHVLYEQQKKIEQLRNARNREVEAEKRIAARLSNNLKNGLLTHLKSDVDLEVKRVLSPKDLLRAEKSKKALQQKLKHAKAAKTAEKEREKQSDVRSAVKHSMNKALNGVYEAEKKAREADEQEADKKEKERARHHSAGAESAHASSASGSAAPGSKKKCDPLAGLYKSGIVSWC